MLEMGREHYIYKVMIALASQKNYNYVLVSIALQLYYIPLGFSYKTAIVIT